MVNTIPAKFNNSDESSQVHMIRGMGTKLQMKMDAALKQCMPMEVSIQIILLFGGRFHPKSPPNWSTGFYKYLQMMAATVDDMQMQALSMSPDTKVLQM